MIAIIDYGMGNFAAIKNMLDKFNIESIVVSEPSNLKKASKIILPGVGSFDAGVNKLKESGFFDVIVEKAIEKKFQFWGYVWECNYSLKIVMKV